MKKIALITTWAVIGWLLVASISTWMAYIGQWKNNNTNSIWNRMWYVRSASWYTNSNYDLYAKNITRTVNNIANWVEITMTTSDSATLEHMKSMFTQNKDKISPNSLIKTERTELSNWTKLTITSTDADTVKLIQDRAKNAKMGAFGKWTWMWGKMWRMWKWRGGRWQWNCTMQ